MDHSIRVTYDEDILKKGVRAFVLYRICKGFAFLGLAIFLVTLPLLMIFDALHLIPDFLIGILILFVVMNALAYWANLRLKLSRFRQMHDDPAITIILSEDGFEVSSALGASARPWLWLRGMLKKPELWLLYGPKNEYIVLPTVGISAASLDYLEQKVAHKK